MPLGRVTSPDNLVPRPHGPEAVLFQGADGIILGDGDTRHAGQPTWRDAGSPTRRSPWVTCDDAGFFTRFNGFDDDFDALPRDLNVRTDARGVLRSGGGLARRATTVRPSQRQGHVQKAEGGASLKAHVVVQSDGTASEIGHGVIVDG